MFVEVSDLPAHRTTREPLSAGQWGNVLAQKGAGAFVRTMIGTEFVPPYVCQL